MKEQKSIEIIELYANKQDSKKIKKIEQEYKHHMKKATLLKNKVAHMNLRFNQKPNR